MGELARLFGQLTPVKYPSLSPIACSKCSLVVPASACCGLGVTVLDAFVLHTASEIVCLILNLVCIFIQAASLSVLIKACCLCLSLPKISVIPLLKTKK